MTTINNETPQQYDYELYGAQTSNVYKILIMFKELGITSYRFHNVDIMNGEQFKPEFLKLNPNNKVPVIVDNTVSPPFPVFESGAILIYLAEKHGKFLAGTDKPIERSETLQWVAWQISGQGPMTGQYIHFKVFAKEKIQYALDRYYNETVRLNNVLNTRLEGRTYLVGDSLTIADIAVYGWAFYLYFNFVIEEWESKFPNVKKWLDHLTTTHPNIKEVFESAEVIFRQRMATFKKE